MTDKKRGRPTVKKIQHCSEFAHWRAIKSFELAIIQHNDWRVEE